MIWMEAYEAHMIEKEEKEKNYKKTYDSFRSIKQGKWENILKNIQLKIPFTKEEMNFLLNESSIGYLPTVDYRYAFIQEHIERMKKEEEYQLTLRRYNEKTMDYYEFLRICEQTRIKIVGSKKVFETRIQQAKSLLEKHKADEKAFEKEWGEKKKKIKTLVSTFEKQGMLSKEQEKEMILFAGLSYQAQNISYEYFFAHHFDRVRFFEDYHNKIEEIKKLTNPFEKLIQKWARQKPYQTEARHVFKELKKETENLLFLKHWDYRKLLMRKNQEVI